jgi:hypothetical protein
MQKIVVISILMAWVFYGCGTADSANKTADLSANPTEGLAKGSELMFSGFEDHDIDMDVAEKMMADFRENNPYKAYGWYIGRVAIEDLLGEAGAVGMRIYGGLDNEGEFSPVIFAVDSLGYDLPRRGLEKQLDMGPTASPKEKLPPCPPYCL